MRDGMVTQTAVWRDYLRYALSTVSRQLGLPLTTVRLVGRVGHNFEELHPDFWAYLERQGARRIQGLDTIDWSTLPTAAAADSPLVEWMGVDLETQSYLGTVLWTDEFPEALTVGVQAVYHPEWEWGLWWVREVYPYAPGYLVTVPPEVFGLIRPITSQKPATTCIQELKAQIRRYRRDQQVANGWDGLFAEGQARREPPLLILPPDLERALREDIHAFFHGKDRYERFGLPYRRGIILYGPPGNGKTTTAQALALSIPDAYRMVRPLSYKTTETDLVQWFATASEMAPSVLVLEDLDTIADEQSHIARSFLLNLLDGIQTVSSGVYIIATTNYPDRIDFGFFRRPGRFDRHFEIPAPQASERARYLAARFGADLPDTIQQALVRYTEGLSMAALNELGMSYLWAAANGEPWDPKEAVQALKAIYAKHSRGKLARPTELGTPLGFVFQPSEGE